MIQQLICGRVTLVTNPLESVGYCTRPRVMFLTLSRSVQSGKFTSGGCGFTFGDGFAVNRLTAATVSRGARTDGKSANCHAGYIVV